VVALSLVFIVLVFLTADFFVQRAAFKRASARPPVAIESLVHMIPVPDDVFLDPSHVWARITGGGLLQLGADSLISSLLGEPDRIEAAKEGSRVKRGEPLVTISRAGRSVTLRSPVDGVLVRVNRETADQPWKLGSAPFGHSWIYEVKPDRLGPAVKRMYVDGEAKAFVAGELRRLRDAVSSRVRRDPVLGATALDGGTPHLGETATDPSLPAAAHRFDDESWSLLIAEFFAGTYAAQPAADRA
jgi:glycine cleavage system H lipoate-binding protein